MPETITVIAEKMGSLTLEGGIGVRIVQVDGGGLRLFFDRPFMYCGDAVVFEGGEEEAEEGEQSGVSPITRAWRKRPPPPRAMRPSIRSAKRDAITGMGLID